MMKRKIRRSKDRIAVTYDSYFGANVAKPHMEVLSADEFRRSRRGTEVK